MSRISFYMKYGIFFEGKNETSTNSLFKTFFF
jgi:hypothetical protein